MWRCSREFPLEKIPLNVERIPFNEERIPFDEELPSLKVVIHNNNTQLSQIVGEVRIMLEELELELRLGLD